MLKRGRRLASVTKLCAAPNYPDAHQHGPTHTSPQARCCKPHKSNPTPKTARCHSARTRPVLQGLRTARNSVVSSAPSSSVAAPRTHVNHNHAQVMGQYQRKPGQCASFGRALCCPGYSGLQHRAAASRSRKRRNAGVNLALAVT